MCEKRGRDKDPNLQFKPMESWTGEPAVEKSSSISRNTISNSVLVSRLKIYVDCEGGFLPFDRSPEEENE